jgi:hypothetical protein
MLKNFLFLIGTGHFDRQAPPPQIYFQAWAGLLIDGCGGVFQVAKLLIPTILGKEVLISCRVELAKSHLQYTSQIE